MRNEKAGPDRVVARIAARQFTVASTKQLQAAGLTRQGIHRRVQRGWFHPLHRGVYAVGNPNPSIEGKYLAAVLACGEGAVLSHLSAAAHWRLLPHAGGPVHVTIPDRGSRRRRRGIHIHRSSVLGFQETTRHRGIPVTNPGRTLADLRRAEPPELGRRAARQAAVFGLNTGDDGDDDRTRSELERRAIWLFQRHRIPLPEVNVYVAGLLVDFLWRPEWLIVEVDGWRYHRGRDAFEDDRGRDARLRQLGFEVLRFSYRQVFEEPELVIGLIQDAIQSRSALLSRHAEQKRRQGPGAA